jgi:hypothetical protein
MEPVYEISRQPDFRRNPAPGWAVFLAPGLFRSQPLPFGVRELVVIDDRFHVNPLLTALQMPEPFYLLELSKDRARLFAAVRGSVAEVPDTPFPPGPIDAGAVGSGRIAAWIHRLIFWRRIRADPPSQHLLAWFRRVDEVLRDRLSEAAPVILVTNRDLCVMFHVVSRYPRLLDGGIEPNGRNLSPQELWHQGCDMALAYCRSTQRKVTDEYLRLWHTQRASNDVRDIAAAARLGRVQTLLVSEAAERQSVREHHEPGPEVDDEAQDLLRLAVIDTVVAGGTAFSLPADQVPGSGPAAAVFRY